MTKQDGIESAEIRRKGHNFVKAQNISDTILVFPASKADFRNGEVLHYGTGSISYLPTPIGEGVVVVMRGIPSEILEEEILLQLLGFSAESVARMRRSMRLDASDPS